MTAKRATPTRWKAAARRALDTWAPSLEASVALALQRSYQEGVIFSARAADAKGQAELARELRAAAREFPP